VRGELLRQRGVTRFRGQKGDLRVSRPTVVVGEGSSMTMRLRRAGPGEAGALGCRPVRGLMRAIHVRMAVRCRHMRSHESVIIPTRTPLLGPRLRMLCGFVMGRRVRSGRGDGVDCSSFRVIATIARYLGSGGRALSRCGVPRRIADVASITSNPVSRPCGR